MKHPFDPTALDVKSGWKNNSKLLSEIVTNLNEEVYIEDENGMMEKIDIVLEYLKSKFNITKK